MIGLRAWPELHIRSLGSWSSACFIVLFCGLLHDTRKRVLIKCLRVTHSISNRNTLPTEKCLPRILLLRAPTGQGVPRQYTEPTVMSYIIAPRFIDMQVSQCRLFQMEILSKHFRCVTLCTMSQETEPIACHTQQLYILGQQEGDVPKQLALLC